MSAIATGKIKWSVGDKAYYEHRLVTIKEIDEQGRVRTVSDGLFETGCLDHTPHLFPVSTEGHRIVSFYDREYDKLYNGRGHLGGNWPDIHRYVCDLFDTSMRYLESEDEKKLASSLENAEDFFKKARAEFDRMTGVVVQGVFLFREYRG